MPHSVWHITEDWRGPVWRNLPKEPLITLSGRAPVCLIDHPCGKVVERPYRHGGLRRLFWPYYFLESARAHNEYRVHQLAYEAGVPTSEPIGWREQKTKVPLFRHYYYYNRYIDQAVTLPVYVTKQNLTTTQLNEMANALRQLYDIRIYHRDLNLNNWLVGKQGNIYLIDFDKATSFHMTREEYASASLKRMIRSALKLGFGAQRRLFFRWVVALARRFECHPKVLLDSVPEKSFRVGVGRTLGWKISGGHRKP